MARVTYQASAQDKPWSPNLVPDTADRILKQSEDYIKKLQAARDFEAAQDAQFVQEYSSSLQRGVDQKKQVDNEQERQARALASYKKGLLADQARRARTVGGSVTGDDNKTMQWVKFISEASTTAAKAYSDVGQIRDKADQVVAQELRTRYSVYANSIGNNFKIDSQRIADQGTFNAAQIAEINGNSQLANDLRKMTPGVKAHFDKFNGVDVGRNLAPNFERDIYAKESVVDVMIDGEMKPINQVRGVREMEQAIGQYRDFHFRRFGLDPSSELMTKGLAESQQGWESLLGGYRKQEIAADKNNLMDDFNTNFTIRVQNPDEAQAATIDLYQANYNLNGGDHKAARTALMEAFKNPGQTSQEAFLAFQQTVLPGQNKSIEELYGDEVREVRQARINESSQIQSESDIQQRTEAKAEAQRVYQARISDTEQDNDVDLSPENVKAQIQKYERLGPNWSEAKKAWSALIPELSSTKRDEELNDTFQDLSDRGALSDDFIMRSDGSEELKRKWLKSVNASAEQGVNKNDVEDFEDLARTMLMDRSGETPGMSGRSNNAYTKRALRYAVKQYTKDYVVGLRDGQTPAQAAAYAEGRFNDTFSNESGKYKVSQATEFENGTEIIVGQYSGFGPQSAAAIEEPFVNLNKKIEELGSAVVDSPDVIPKPVLERVSKDLLQNKRIMIPPAIVALADSTGGKLSVMDVLNRQLKVNGIEQINPDVFSTAQQAQDTVAPIWQQRLNYKPTFESTDVAMIGSGQEPIYDQRIPANIKSDVPFQQAVVGLSQRLGVSASDLYAIMDFETGGTFDPAQRNMAGSGATGLIQIMPSTAVGLGTTTEALASMSRIEQLGYVEKYFQRTGIKPGANLSDLYMAVLFPAAVGKGDDFVLFGNGAMSDYQGTAYTQNRGLDSNGDGSITKAEAAAKVLGSANTWRQTRNLNPALASTIATTPIPSEQPPTDTPELLTRTKEEGPGSGNWTWDEKRQLFVKIN